MWGIKICKLNCVRKKCCDPIKWFNPATFLHLSFKPRLGFPTSHVIVFLCSVSSVRLIIVHFVDIGGIGVQHKKHTHCLKDQPRNYDKAELCSNIDLRFLSKLASCHIIIFCMFEFDIYLISQL